MRQSCVLLIFDLLYGDVIMTTPHARFKLHSKLQHSVALHGPIQLGVHIFQQYAFQGIRIFQQGFET